MKIPPKLLLLFIAIPVIEVFLFVKIGGAIGLWATLGIIVVTAIFGAWLTRTQGLRALARLHGAAQEGRPLHGEIFGGILILIAGILLITPGFLTDALGFLLLAPNVRNALISRIALSLNERFSFRSQSTFKKTPPQPPVKHSREKSPGRRPKGKIIDAKIIDE